MVAQGSGCGLQMQLGRSAHHLWRVVATGAARRSWQLDTILRVHDADARGSPFDAHRLDSVKPLP
jgi:hypothetical protein